MNKEQKIAEIREALEKATPGPWKLVMDSYDDEEDTKFPWMIINYDGTVICDFNGGGDVKLENAHLMANAPEWPRFLLDELDRLRAERDSHGPEGRNYTNMQYVDLLAERDKLIEGLRWYADEKNYRQELRSRHGTLVQPAEEIYYDSGQRARDILKEIGVTDV